MSPHRIELYIHVPVVVAVLYGIMGCSNAHGLCTRLFLFLVHVEKIGEPRLDINLILL